MKFNVIETSEMTIGKFQEITKYLSNQLISTNMEYIRGLIDLNDLLEKSIEITNVMSYINKQANDNSLIKLYRDEFDELCWEDISI